MEQVNTEVTSLASSAVLVDLNIAMWTARKTDKKVSEEIDAAKGTKARSGNFHKKLLAGNSLLDEMQKFVTEVRTYHYAVTQPWSDSGTRLLMMGRFMEYNTKMRDYQAKFQDFKQQFTEKYNEMVSTAAFTLGELFNREDYPMLETIEKKFYLNYEYTPVPVSGDFRVDIGNEGIQELIGRYETQFQSRVKVAMQDAWDRLHECVSRISERLDFTGENGDKKIFRDSLVDNALELVDLLKHMNITADAEMERSRKQLEQAISSVSAQELRESPEIRKDVKSQVDDILKRMSF